MSCLASEPAAKRQLLVQLGPAQLGLWLAEARPLTNPDLAAEAQTALTEVAQCGFDEIFAIGGSYLVFNVRSKFRLAF